MTTQFLYDGVALMEELDRSDKYVPRYSRGTGDGTAPLTAASAITNDSIGNLTSVDGPLSGTADTTAA